MSYSDRDMLCQLASGLVAATTEFSGLAQQYKAEELPKLLTELQQLSIRLTVLGNATNKILDAIIDIATADRAVEIYKNMDERLDSMGERLDRATDRLVEINSVLDALAREKGI